MDDYIKDAEELLITVSSYNGLSKYLLRWRLLLDRAINCNAEMMVCPGNYGMSKEEFENAECTYWQLQILWMQLVLMFGDYGTSPRFGWITDIEGFRNFLMKLVDYMEE